MIPSDFPTSSPTSKENTAPTTRQLRHQPRLIVHTGDGKGKTTAAFGMALRAWARGWNIGVYQFIKSTKWRSGEQRALETLGNSGDGGQVTWSTMGQGWTWLRANADLDQVELALAGWQRVRDLLARQAHDFYLLDEFNHVLARGWIDVDEVVEVLTNRPGTQHVVITGRGAPAALVEAADLVTEMVSVKHPFDLGQRGQAGIEW